MPLETAWHSPSSMRGPAPPGDNHGCFAWEVSMSLHPRHDRMVVPGTTVPAHARVRTFSLPFEVVEEPSLCLADKRAILAEWASDRSAVESWPTLRRLP